MMNERNETSPVTYEDYTITFEQFQEAARKLQKLEHGHDVYCWLRRRASAHHEHVHGSELEGSSDVSGHLFNLWKQYCWRHNPRRVMNDGFGFWINCDIKESA